MSVTERIIAGAAPAVRPHVLHVFPSFGIGGVPLRMVSVMNHFGKQFRHTIAALDDKFDAASGIAVEVDAQLVPLRQRDRGMLRNIIYDARTLRCVRADLLVTYNWGSIEWAMANRLTGASRHIHFEDGFGKDEADAQLRRRVLFRRWALARCSKIVVPSHQLENLAHRVWKLPRQRVAFVPNGVNLDRFAKPASDKIVGFAKRPGEVIIGTVAPLRPEKNIGRLLRAFASLEHPAGARLVVAGDGSERAGLEQLAKALGVADSVVFTGHVAPETVLGRFDIFAMSSDTEQMPITILEAMAASRPVVSVDVGDVKSMVCEENRQFIVPRDDVAGLTAILARLLRQPASCAEIGRKNRERVAAEFSLDRMFSAYSEIFAAGRLN